LANQRNESNLTLQIKYNIFEFNIEWTWNKYLQTPITTLTRHKVRRSVEKNIYKAVQTNGQNSCNTAFTNWCAFQIWNNGFWRQQYGCQMLRHTRM